MLTIPDVDRPFGSVGSFFDQDLVGKVSTVNPPYVGSIFDRILAKIQESIERALRENKPMMMSIGVPAWMDDNLIMFLEKTKYLKYKRVLSKHEYTYVDTKFDSFIPAPFPNIDYIVSVNVDHPSYENTFGRYFDECKAFSGKLIKLKWSVKKLKTFDFGIQMNYFNCKYIADTLRMEGLADDIMELFKNIPSTYPLSTHLLADAFINLDQKNTKKYNRKEVLSYVERELQKILN